MLPGQNCKQSKFKGFGIEAKLYIPSTMQLLKKRWWPKPFGETSNGLVFGRVACTFEILNKIQDEQNMLDGKLKEDKPQAFGGFAENRST